jgi:hypothetical protein
MVKMNIFQYGAYMIRSNNKCIHALNKEHEFYSTSMNQIQAMVLPFQTKPDPNPSWMIMTLEMKHTFWQWKQHT